jgi:imidazolonepropionase-like amidohydrolase
MKTALTNCTVIDCTGKPPMKNMTVVIEGDQIAALNPGVYQQVDGEGKARVFDLKGGYVLPGLWNCHAHPGDVFPHTPAAEHVMSTESPIARTIRAGRNATDALRRGTTSIRVVGEPSLIDTAWKRAFDAGTFVGPRVFACGDAIGAGMVSGPYEMRRTVREQLKRGADQIKLMMPGLFLDEVKAATEVAHQKGKRVCAHAGNPAIKTAIRGEVDCIEHGYFLDEEAVEMMVENGVFYVPTLVCALDELFMRQSGGFDQFHKGRVVVARFESTRFEESHPVGFRKALKAGVKIACGGDSNPIGEFTLLEIEHLVRWGMTEMEALIAATRTSADLCGVVDELGTVEVGKLADLIVLSTDPLEDISNIRNLQVVFKGGSLVETSEPEGLLDLWEMLLV